MNPALFAMGVLALLISGGAQDSGVKGEARKHAVRARVAETYAVDPVHSTVLFRIKHLDVSYSYGRFNEIEGTFTFDGASAKNNRIDITVKAASVDTNHDGRDEHLRNEDYFDAENHPEITFKSDRVRKTGEKTYEAEGELKLRGVAKPLTVSLERVGSGPDPRGKFRSGFETTFTIKRSDFGMNTMLGPVGDDVRLIVSVEGVRAE